MSNEKQIIIYDREDQGQAGKDSISTDKNDISTGQNHLSTGKNDISMGQNHLVKQ